MKNHDRRKVSERRSSAAGLGQTAALTALSSLSVLASALAQAQTGPIEEVMVTGSRIVRDGVSSPIPITVVDTARVDNLGATNIGHVLNTLPAFRASATPQAANIQARNVGMVQADLRGLGPNRTLVLVNERRFVPSTVERTVDLNQIPTLLLQRAEVVTGGASAQYGSDAVAGVINMIIDNRFEGVRTRVQFGQTEEGDGENYNFGVAGGTGFADGRGHVVASLEYEDQKRVGDCYTRDWCAEEWQVLTNPAQGVPGKPANNILPYTRTVNAVPGGLILTGPLAGTSFRSDGTPYEFEYGDVYPTNPIFMQGGEGYNGFIGAPLILPAVERYNAFVQLNYDLSDSLTSVVEFSHGRVKGRSRGAQTRDFFPGGANAIVIRGDNPYLPESLQQRLLDAGQPLDETTSFVLGRMGDDFGHTQNFTDTEVYRLMLGLEGGLSNGWTWDAHYQYGETNYDQEVRNNRIQQQVPGVAQPAGVPTRIQLAADAVRLPAGEIVCRSTLTDPDNGCVPVNLFGEYQFSDAAKEYLYGTAFMSNDLTQHVFAANIQGELFSTWAGAVPLAAGIEYRSDKVETDADPISATSGFYVANSTIVNGKTEVKEAYVETAFPLARDHDWANYFELNAAVRATDYDTSGSVTTWKVGGVYEPKDWLRFRVTRSRDIRAPNTDELFRPHTSGFVTVGGILTRLVTGGNENLRPEEADTFTVGLTYEGTGRADGLRASVDYYEIDITDAVSTLTAQTLVNRCRDFGLYCDLVTFDPSGGVEEVRTLFQNLDRQQISGVDIELGYLLPLQRGAIDFRLLGTYVGELKTTDATGNAIDRAGVTGNNVSGGGAGLPEWQFNGLMTYTRGEFTFTAEGRYIDSGLFDATLIGPEQEGYDVTLPNSVNTNRVASRFYLNLGMSYGFALDTGARLEIFAGIQNVFDRDPPVAPSNQGSSNLILFDPLGRTYRLGLRASF